MVLCAVTCQAILCFCFTVNQEQTALWDSAFLMAIYSIAELFARIFVNSLRRSQARYVGFTTIASIDSADTVGILR